MTLGQSADGSFVNCVLMDEIRIWGVALAQDQIEQYRTSLAPQDSPGLLAYYRFDDGGITAEDFTRKAQNGLLGGTPYTFGDFGVRAAANNLSDEDFGLEDSDFAPVLGVDARGADDSDGDGMPDAWEVINHLNPLSAAGDDGANGDPDADGLANIYEYWAQTNPHNADTDGNGILDPQEDLDGDGLVNILEQQLSSRPDMVDTDDDGVPDGAEKIAGTSPADSDRSPGIPLPVVWRPRFGLRVRFRSPFRSG